MRGIHRLDERAQKAVDSLSINLCGMMSFRMWPIVALQLVWGITSAEENCTCIPAFMCSDGKFVPSSKCDASLLEACCDVAVAPTITVRRDARETPLPPHPSTSPPPAQDYAECGRRGATTQEEAIDVRNGQSPDIGWRLFEGDSGTETIRGEYPWIAAITVHNTSSGIQHFKCAGTIIFDNIILSTAHNVMDLLASDVIVKAGVWDTADPAEQHVNRGVSRILVHPEFSKDKVQNDFAIIVLNDSLTWSRDVAPVCLPGPGVTFDTDRCIAIGWGKGKQGEQYTTLRQIHIPLTDHTTCQNQLRRHPPLGSTFPLHESFLCGGGKDYDTCEGDGGGPLMCPTSSTASDSHYVQVGITSWGVRGQCYSDLYPGVYSSVAHGLPWIMQQAENNPSVTLRIGK